MNERVLIVDDDRSIRYTVREILTDAGIGLTSADGGKACLTKLRAGFRGVILLDVMMPEMDGWQTIQAIKDEGLLEGNIICMLTAVNTPGSEMDCLKECVVDYVCKPFTEDELLTALEVCLSYIQMEPIS